MGEGGFVCELIQCSDVHDGEGRKTTDGSRAKHGETSVVPCVFQWWPDTDSDFIRKLIPGDISRVGSPNEE